MDAERLAELRQQGERRGSVLMWHYEFTSLVDERDALREALSSVLTVIDGDYGINGKTSLCVRAAEVLLEQGGGE